ncbi:helix-turn-helix domain-containing protein [Croceivirga sp. JEA036]|uniref:helix-turn-helix domain-containing protein n=1 Tax=Croceivirga sp. JEA036 TaxID=2721162 RepID=UPI00143C8AF9|nr:helix-turn-helix domain-containing protein [Croceivirga sp. JEA036]NJB35308.1 helix-turn-helix domain-containing protein [Croceivirga sp. JEA036]
MQKQNTNSNHERLHIVTQKEILSFREALLYMDVSQSFLYKLTSKKAIEFTKPNGGKIYFRKSDLDKWMLQNESTSARVLQDKVLNHLKSKNNG